MRCERPSPNKFSTLVLINMLINNKGLRNMVRKFVRSRKLIGFFSLGGCYLESHLFYMRIIFHWLCSRIIFSYMHYNDIRPFNYSFRLEGIDGLSYLKALYDFDMLQDLALYYDSFLEVTLSITPDIYYVARDYLNLYGLPCYKQLAQW